MSRLGYQVSVDVVTHRQNMAVNCAPQPVLVLTEVLENDAQGWQRSVHQVRFTGPARTEYGWGPERAHARGTRFDASIWVFTECSIEFLDENHEWRRAE